MNKHYLTLLQKRIGSLAVGASTARGMGPPGTIQAARAFLAALDLRRFRVQSRNRFETLLNTVTEELRSSLPPKAQHWGSARQYLNIFLRDCLYDQYLSERYNLSHLEPWLEVPLDKQVAKGLRKLVPSVGAPRWKTVIGLAPDCSALFQDAAARAAKRDSVCRVHLDLRFYRNEA